MNRKPYASRFALLGFSFVFLSVLRGKGFVILI